MPSDPTTATDFTHHALLRNFRVAGGEFHVGEWAISDLADRYGTPLFVYNADVLRRQWSTLRETFPEPFQIHYSVKANPNQAILRFFLEQGAGLEIASAGELHQSLTAGCRPEAILFAGPGKTEPELATALAEGVGEIHVESLTEATRLARLAEQVGRKARVSLRVNPAAAVEGGGMRMGAKPVAFGIDEDQLASIVEQLLKEHAIEIVGLHLFVGTQILDHNTLLAQYAAGIEIALKLSALIGKPLETIDFGGGLGVPYFPHEPSLDMLALKDGLQLLLASLQQEPALRNARLIVEPGRFLVAESGVYVARVNDIKVSRGKKFVITDGGMHHHLAASGNLGQTIKRNFPVALLNRLAEPIAERVDVAGPLCTPLDVLARDIELPVVQIGDLVGVLHSGAYARSASPWGFLSHPTPPEVLVDGHREQLIRRRGTIEDFLLDQPVVDRLCTAGS